MQGVQILRREKAEQEREQKAQDIELDAVAHEQLQEEPEAEESELDGVQTHDAVVLHEIMKAESKIPVGKLLIVGVAWIVMLLSALLKGTKTSSSLVGIQCNSAGYWFIMMVPLPIILIATIILSVMVRRTHLLKMACGYQYQVCCLHSLTIHAYYM